VLEHLLYQCLNENGGRRNEVGRLQLQLANGELPLGSMAAGCDICQEVCPWTRRAPADLQPAFAPAPHRYRPLLADLEAVDEKGYRGWRRGSPLNRISFSQLRRNLSLVRRNL